MKRVYLHVKRLFKKYGFFILFVTAISFPAGLTLAIVMTVISLLYFDDPVDTDAILKNFTEREVDIVLSEKMDERVTDDEYLELLARFQSYICPKKIDSATIWTGSRVTADSYICEYEIKERIEGLSMEQMKINIYNAINKSSVQVQRMVRTNRNMIFRYTYRDNRETFDVVISTEELKG